MGHAFHPDINKEIPSRDLGTWALLVLVIALMFVFMAYIP